MTPVSSRMKDALWSIRRQYGMESDLDRIIKFIVFDQNFTENLFVDYPTRIPEVFTSALLARIRQTIREYWTYRQTRKGYHKVIKGIIFLEDVARYGFEGCQLVPDKNTGYVLELKGDK